jgi:hypothetical protein
MGFKDFNFYVGGIEAGIIGALGEFAYASPAEPYRDELDDEELESEAGRALTRLAGRLPLFLASYVDGTLSESDCHPWLYGEPRIFRHDAVFTVLCCAPDWPGALTGQSEGTAGVGVRRMVSDSLAGLSGKMFRAADPADPETLLDLNLSPLKPSPVGRNPVPILRRDEVVVYAVYFETYFLWEAPPPGPSEPVTIEEIRFILDVTNGPSGRGGLPGVHVS